MFFYNKNSSNRNYVNRETHERDNLQTLKNTYVPQNSMMQEYMAEKNSVGFEQGQNQLNGVNIVQPMEAVHADKFEREIVRTFNPYELEKSEVNDSFKIPFMPQAKRVLDGNDRMAYDTRAADMQRNNDIYRADANLQADTNYEKGKTIIDSNGWWTSDSFADTASKVGENDLTAHDYAMMYENPLPKNASEEVRNNNRYDDDDRWWKNEENKVIPAGRMNGVPMYSQYMYGVEKNKNYMPDEG